MVCQHIYAYIPSKLQKDMHDLHIVDSDANLAEHHLSVQPAVSVLILSSTQWETRSSDAQFQFFSKHPAYLILPVLEIKPRAPCTLTDICL